MKNNNQPENISEPVSALDRRMRAISDYIDAMPFRPNNHWEMMTCMMQDFNEILKQINAKRDNGIILYDNQ